MTTRDLNLIALFAALTAVSAQVSVVVPFLSIVPFTLQVFAVLAAGAILGARRGALSQFVYLLLGAAGAPVFARWHGGPQALVAPTGGYLWAFPIAAAVAGGGWDAWSGAGGRWRHLRWLALAGGLLIIYALGAAGLVVTRTVPNVRRAIEVGVLPFAGVDLVKALVAGWVADRVRAAVPAMAPAISRSRR